MNKDLTWKLKDQPTAGELNDMVKLGVITKQEMRNIIFNKGKSENVSNLTTVVHVLLDASGSMSGVRDATIDSCNEYIDSLRGDGGKFKINITAFDSDMSNKLRLKEIAKNTWVDDLSAITRDDYEPNGGTPLHDAFVKTLKAARPLPNEKHLFVVLTDGAENSSTKYSAGDMKETKEQFEKEGNWTFVYLGANQDSFKTSASYGFSTSNTSNFNATEKGMNIMVSSLSSATRSMSAAPTMSTDAYFTSVQQEENEKTK